MTRVAALRPALALGAILAAALPAPVSAGSAPRASASTSPPSPFAARVLRLHAPASTMIRIAKGTAVMGSTPEEVVAAAALCAKEALAYRCSEQTFADELGRQTFEMDAFWIDRTEVTVAEYARCVAVGRCRPAAYGAGARRFERPDYPVSLVSWEDARDYCAFRGARLPSEAEYERAARGAVGRTYPWGDVYNAHVANHGRFAVLRNDDSDGFGELAPVGSFPEGRTPDGVLDLAGNVAEWAADVYRERYDDPPPDNPTNEKRVLRGGSFVSGAAWLRGAARDAAAPETQRPDIGFRCARDARTERP